MRSTRIWVSFQREWTDPDDAWQWSYTCPACVAKAEGITEVAAVVNIRKGYVVPDRERVKTYEDNKACLVEMKFKGSRKEKRTLILELGTSLFAPPAFAINVIAIKLSVFFSFLSLTLAFLFLLFPLSLAYFL